jgi:hypothetical protein
LYNSEFRLAQSIFLRLGFSKTHPPRDEDKNPEHGDRQEDGGGAFPLEYEQNYGGQKEFNG